MYEQVADLKTRLTPLEATMGVWSRAVVGSLQAVNPKLAPLNSGVSFSSVGLFHFNSDLADIGRGMGAKEFFMHRLSF